MTGVYTRGRRPSRSCCIRAVKAARLVSFRATSSLRDGEWQQKQKQQGGASSGVSVNWHAAVRRHCRCGDLYQMQYIPLLLLLLAKVKHKIV